MNEKATLHQMFYSGMYRNARQTVTAKEMRDIFMATDGRILTNGQLNPTWVEWLMGYPSGWTALEDWAMQWFRPKRGKRSKD